MTGSGKLSRWMYVRSVLILSVIVLIASTAIAQDRSESPLTPPEPGTEWQPIGSIAVDQAGAGLRGYALPGEDGEVTPPGTNQFSLHTVASNNLYREQAGTLLITERFEAHAGAVGYRRGFRVRGFPRFELGGQVQFIESDAGFLNGFITGFEDMVASLTGHDAARNTLRTGQQALPPVGVMLTSAGHPLYAVNGGGSGLGDVSLVGKAMLFEGGAASNGTSVAARLSLNLAGASEFTSGNFGGIGLSLDQPLSSWAAFHGDVRATALIDRVSQWNLPLRRSTVGFSAATELKITRNNSVTLQYDGTTTPFQTTGTMAFDKPYGDLAIGVSHRSANGRLVTQFYARENMNLPLQVRQNIDPDLAVGIKTTFRVR